MGQTSDVWAIVKAGGRFYVARAEVKITLGSGARELGLRPSVFIDAGAVFDTETPVLVRLANVAALRDLWNDRQLGSYEGSTWKVWRARGATVERIELTSKRLFW